MPTPIRYASRSAKLAAAPHSAVIRLHSARHTTITLLREERSASRAIGTPRVA